MPIPRIVAKVMTSNPRTLTASDSVRTAAREMKRLDMDAVVVEHEGRTLGVVTDRDLVRGADTHSDTRLPPHESHQEHAG